MKVICDHCKGIIGDDEYGFSVNHKHYYACSSECFKNLLHKQGIYTYPFSQLPNKQADVSEKLQKNGFLLSLIALFLSAISLIMHLL